jgi:hypothetical protein
MGQLDTMREMGSLNGGLDACGIRGFFGIKLFCYLRHQAPQSAPSHVSSSTAFWMLHSESQEALLEMLLSKKYGTTTGGLDWLADSFSSNRVFWQASGVCQHPWMLTTLLSLSTRLSLQYDRNDMG